MQPWVIVAAPVKLISPTREERECEKKGQSIREGCQAGRLRDARMGIGGKGVCASSPLVRAAYRSPHRNSNLFGPFFRATCRWTFSDFFFPSGRAGRVSGIELQFARHRGQKRKPTNLAARSKNASRREIKKIRIPTHVFDFSASLLVKRSSCQTSECYSCTVTCECRFSKNIRRSLLIKNIDSADW